MIYEILSEEDTKKLEFQNCSLDSKKIGFLINQLRGLKQLEYLSLAGNSLEYIDIRTLNVKRVDLSKNCLKGVIFSKIGLEEMDISSNDLKMDEIRSIISQVGGSNLKNLNLYTSKGVDLDVLEDCICSMIEQSKKLEFFILNLDPSTINESNVSFSLFICALLDRKV